MDALVIRTPRMASSLNAIASIILSENASCVLALRHSSERGDMEIVVGWWSVHASGARSGGYEQALSSDP
jgi:hypothetical protein